MLKGMLAVQPFFPDYQLVIAGAPSIERHFYEPCFKHNPSVFLVQNQTYDLLSHASAALVTSGTATLEAALFNVPQVVCYSGNWFSYQLAKRLVNENLRFIAMANLIADKKVVAELIQTDFNTENLQRELAFCLSANGSTTIKKGYLSIRNKLYLGGVSERVGRLMVERLMQKNQAHT